MKVQVKITASLGHMILAPPRILALFMTLNACGIQRRCAAMPAALDCAWKKACKAE